ncbi:hypothetical protein DSUL_50418 [Desulfovibrionales bacterium]
MHLQTNLTPTLRLHDTLDNIQQMFPDSLSFNTLPSSAQRPSHG